MIKIIIKFLPNFSDFAYINHKYLMAFQEFFHNYLQNNTVNIHKISSKKFQKELDKFYTYIYNHDFFTAWSLVFKDKITVYILHMKDVDILQAYFSYKYKFWNCFFEKILYSYGIFILTIFISFFIRKFLFIGSIMYIYIISYMLLQIIFHIGLVELVKWNYKIYLNEINKNHLLENRIYSHEFLENYRNLNNNRDFNVNNIYKMKINNFQDRFESLWKMIFLLPSILNLVNLSGSITYVFFIIYMMFQNILSINVI